jgi:hypothetical protein
MLALRSGFSQCHLILGEPDDADQMLRVLRRIGARTAMADLARRAAEHAPVSSLLGVCNLLVRLRKLRKTPEALILARRVADQATFTDPRDCDPRPHESNFLRDLEEELHKIGATEQADALIRRAADADLFYGFLRTYAPEQIDLYRYGREPDGSPSRPWTWAPNEPR